MANGTMTERAAWTEVITLATAAGNTELATFAEGRIAKLNARNATRKPTATQIENEALRGRLFAAMETGVTYTAAQLAAMIGVTTAKASALARQLVEAGVAEKTEVKIKANKAEGIKGGKVNGYIALAPETETETEGEG